MIFLYIHNISYCMYLRVFLYDKWLIEMIIVCIFTCRTSVESVQCISNQCMETRGRPRAWNTWTGNCLYDLIYINVSCTQTKPWNFFILSVCICILSVNIVSKFGQNDLNHSRGVAVFIVSCKMPYTSFVLSFVMTKLGVIIEYEQINSCTKFDVNQIKT